MTEQQTGLLHGLLAHVLWGIVAAYWKLLGGIDPVVVVAYRAGWSMIAFVAVVVVVGRLAELRAALLDLRVLCTMAISALMLATNWSVFVWATIEDRLIDASLGYFITPLLSVALGAVVLREPLRRSRWIALVLATIGLGIMAWSAGGVPWVALALAGSWAVYGLVRKTARVHALVGTTIETLVIVPLALAYLVIAVPAAEHPRDVEMHLLVAGTGAVTAVPLLLFTSAARRLPLSTLGFLQYLPPSMQFLLAVIAFGEPLDLGRAAAFSVIWLGLAVFTVDLVRARR